MNKSKYKKMADPKIGICKEHKPFDGGMLRWFSWAENLRRKGVKQKQCHVCTLWLFPEEF